MFYVMLLKQLAFAINHHNNDSMLCYSLSPETLNSLDKLISPVKLIVHFMCILKFYLEAEYP